MKYWITKYALSEGIFTIDIPKVPDDDGYLGYIENSPWRQHSYNKNEWHRTEEGANIRADHMRVAKIASLERQIDKLKAMKFDVGEA